MLRNKTHTHTHSHFLNRQQIAGAHFQLPSFPLYIVYSRYDTLRALCSCLKELYYVFDDDSMRLLSRFEVNRRPFIIIAIDSNRQRRCLLEVAIIL